jgi:hypothetical protein
MDLDNEQLQLYLDQETLSKRQLDKALLWMALRDKQLVGLELPTTSCLFVENMVSQPTFGSSLTYLNIQGTNTLLGLLTTAVELPHLEQLRASLSNCDDWVDKWEFGFITTHDGPVCYVDTGRLQKVCPRLTDMWLELSDGKGGAPQHADHVSLEHLLSEVLPPTLQNLRLHWQMTDNTYVFIQPDLALSHLTGLQELELSCLGITDTASLLSLPPQCSLQLVDCDFLVGTPIPDCWVDLKHRLTLLNLGFVDGDCGVVGQLTRLTSLGLDLYNGYNGGPEPVPGPGPVMSRLTALNQLQLRGQDGHSQLEMEKVLQHVRSTSSLRLLALSTHTTSVHGLMAAAGALTQLTHLCLAIYPHMGVGAPAAGQVPAEQQQQQLAAAGGQEAAAVQQQQQHATQEGPAAELVGLGTLATAQQALPLQEPVGGPLQALQELVGLRQLQLSATYLLHHPTGWLSALTQLTSVAVEFPQHPWFEGEQPLAAEQQQAAAQEQQAFNAEGEQFSSERDSPQMRWSSPQITRSSSKRVKHRCSSSSSSQRRWPAVWQPWCHVCSAAGPAACSSWCC